MKIQLSGNNNTIVSLAGAGTTSARTYRAVK